MNVSRFKKTRHKKRKGRCFELSLMYMIRNEIEGFMLVHGYRWVEGMSPFNHHAWVEDDETNMIYDLVENEFYDKDEYYKDFNIHHTKRYTREEAAIKLSQSGHSGPWDFWQPES